MHDAHALLPAAIYLAAGLAAILLTRWARLPAIVGFLALGMVLGGPGSLGLLEDNATTALLAELGVVFLLFDIGLKFSVRELWERKSDMLGLAPAQMTLCGAVLVITLRLFGADWPIAIALGAALALSSTAVVVPLLRERNLATCPLGRSAMAMLIFQDIVAIFLLIFAASLASGGGGGLGADIGLAALKAAAAFAVALVIGRFLIGPVFRVLARTASDGIFTASGLLLVVAGAWATGELGLSMTLGAFLAGMVVAETRYRHVIETETKPFRNLLLGLFFISVGMSVDPGMLIRYFPAVILITLALLLVKTGLIALAARMNGWTGPGSLQLSFLLAQSSEFALVIIAMPAIAGALGDEIIAVLVAGIALSLAITPAWASLGMRLSRALARRRRPGEAAVNPDPGRRPVIVFGMDETGRVIVDALNAADLDYIALEIDPDNFISALADGYTVTYGDAADLRLLDTIGATDACALVITRHHYDLSRELTPFVREHYPALKRYVAVDNPFERERHEKLGMEAVIVRGNPPGAELAVRLLRDLEVDKDVITAWLRDVRAKRADRADVIEPKPEEEAA